jgi:hypothetical protein
MITPGSRVIRATDVSKDGTIQWVDETETPVLLPTQALKPYTDITRQDIQISDMKGIELVMLGSIWRDLPVETKQSLLPYVRVFARTNPDDKVRPCSTPSPPPL